MGTCGFLNLMSCIFLFAPWRFFYSSQYMLRGGGSPRSCVNLITPYPKVLNRGKLWITHDSESLRLFLYLCFSCNSVYFSLSYFSLLDFSIWLVRIPCIYLIFMTNGTVFSWVTLFMFGRWYISSPGLINTGPLINPLNPSLAVSSKGWWSVGPWYLEGLLRGLCLYGRLPSTSKT